MCHDAYKSGTITGELFEASLYLYIIVTFKLQRVIQVREGINIYRVIAGYACILITDNRYA